MGQANGVLTTATSAGTLTLIRDSPKKHRFTGTTTHTVLLPPATDIDLGTEYTVFNKSSGAVTVQDSTGAGSMTVSANTTQRFNLVDKTGNGVWIMG